MGAGADNEQVHPSAMSESTDTDEEIAREQGDDESSSDDASAFIFSDDIEEEEAFSCFGEAYDSEDELERLRKWNDADPSVDTIANDDIAALFS